jgi:hypothetical protein
MHAGLPEEMNISRTARDRGYFVVAISSHDRTDTKCWNLPPIVEKGMVSDVVKVTQTEPRSPPCHYAPITSPYATLTPHLLSHTSHTRRSPTSWTPSSTGRGSRACLSTPWARAPAAPLYSSWRLTTSCKGSAPRCGSAHAVLVSSQGGLFMGLQTCLIFEIRADPL